MRTLLLFPPVADPAHPPLGICSLAGFLRAKGADVKPIDLNLRSYNELLTSDVLAQCAASLAERLDEMERQQALPASQFEQYRTVAENLLSGDYLMDSIDEARQRLREPASYASRRTYSEATSIVRRAMEFISAAYFPTKWCPGALTMRYWPTRSADVLAAAADRRENIFLGFLEGCIPEIEVERPRVVGISLNYYCQMIPAITLASLLKQCLPEVYIVVGGGLVCFFEGHWEALHPFSDVVDGWIPFEGEAPLYQLLDALSRSPDVSGVEGLLRFEGRRAVYRPPSEPPSLSELPPPSFSGLPLNEYLSPEPILPLLASRGCYWGRCAFCSHDRLYRGRFRSRNAADLLEVTGALAREYGAKCFYFCDEAIPPKLALEFASAVAGGDSPLRWYGESRFERYFNPVNLKTLHDGGCRMLMFGLESAVERVLAHMEKGIEPRKVAEILRGASDAGIRTFVMYFVGFPTETREEAERTVQFIEDLQDHITHISFTQFVLERYSPVFRHPNRYGVTEMRAYPDHDLKTWVQYDVCRGLTEEEARGLTAVMRRNTGLQSVSGIYLLSRSHLIFLPHKDGSEPVRAAASIGRSQTPNVVPLRLPGLTPRRLAFNLDEVAQRLTPTEGDPGELPRKETDYVFSPQREVLVEVGPNGIDLLGACDGRFTLTEILEAVGEGNRRATLDFFDALSGRDLIAWKAHP